MRIPLQYAAIRQFLCLLLMATYGYARVSSSDQSTDIQVQKLKAAGCQVVRTEKLSGKSREGRDQLATLLEFIGPGDVLVCVKLDRLGRSTRDVLNLVHELTGIARSTGGEASTLIPRQGIIDQVGHADLHLDAGNPDSGLSVRRTRARHKSESSIWRRWPGASPLGMGLPFGFLR
jgi:hypothetical protein